MKTNEAESPLVRLFDRLASIGRAMQKVRGRTTASGEGYRAHNLKAVADANQRPVEVSPVREATALGAAYLAGLATDVWADIDEVRALWSPGERYEPLGSFDRDRWRDAVHRAGQWHADLSALDF